MEEKEKKFYYTVDVWEKRVIMFSDKGEFEFNRRYSGNLRFQTLDNAKQVAQIGGYEHFKVLKSTDGMFGDEVFTTRELQDWQSEQSEVFRRLKINREIRFKLLESLAATTQGFMIGKVELDAVWRVEITAKPEVWYNPSYSKQLNWSANFKVEFFRADVSMGEATELDILAYRTRTGGLRAKKFKDELIWKIRNMVEGIEAGDAVRRMVALSGGKLLKIALSVYDTELKQLFHGLADYTLFSNSIANVKPEQEIVIEVPEKHIDRLKGEAIKALAKNHECSFAEEDIKYTLEYKY